jgi:hypothetical protein
MRRTLDLIPAALSDVAAEGEEPFLLMRAAGPAPRIALTAPGGGAFSLAPGAYVFEIEVRTHDRIAPRLVCSFAAGGAREARLEAQSAYGWRAELDATQTVTGLALALEGLEGAFVVARCRISTEVVEAAPSLRAALMQGMRAIYHKAPRALRREVGRLAARTPGLGAWRRRAIGAEQEGGGEIRITGAGGEALRELEARRADFDARFAAARGMRERATPISVAAAPARAKIIAFHLPQFHRIPENDAWWGAGFTEWANVSKAVAQFVGHHQPRLPGELGFYDLSAPDALRRQVELARAHGVSAFCFHYYWFAGKRLLERPLDAFLSDGSLDIGFSLCWANENWTRRWDGAEDQVLIAQQHSIEDHARVFDDLARYLEDPRAVRVEGKPMIVVYRPAIIGEARAMTEIWRERAVRRGWPGIYLAATDAFQFDQAAQLGFDALIEFPPHGLTPPRIESQLSWLNRQHRGAVFDYAATAEEAIARLKRLGSGRAYDVLPGVMPGWDNEARRPGAGNIFHGATPEAYARWLVAACEAASRTLPADRRFVFVNAWNEWAEGAYLEPDRKWGRAFLEATAQVAGVDPSCPTHLPV